MCGIAGIVALDRSSACVQEHELRAMRDHMATRGPDGLGEWIAPNRRVGLAHRRLAIIDLSDRAAQPMSVGDAPVVITFNGEIYNHVALRRELESKGHSFRTTSDTEVLARMYTEYGTDMLTRLRGMFAFGLWDVSRNSLLLARDPFGIKPLYYAENSELFRFASQVRALLAGGGVSHAIDPAGQVGFYLWGSVPEPFTWYRDVRSVPAGTYLWVTNAGVQAPVPYFSISRIWFDAAQQVETLSTSAVEERVHDALRDSVAHHMVADVHVGAFLSGGIDSGALVGLMKEVQGGGLTGVTLSFREFDGRGDDEVPLAREIASTYDVSHHVRSVSRQEFEGDLGRIFGAMDQPTIDGINTWFVSKAAAERGLKVAISGLGGDELFGGYSSFRDIPRIVRANRYPSSVPGLGKAIRALSSGVLSRIPGVHPKFAGLAEYGGSFAGAYLLKRGLFMPWELNDVLPESIVEEGLERLSALSLLNSLLTPSPEGEFAKVAALEASQYMRNQLLRDTDWASMAHALEVRVPLVDAVLLRTIAPLILAGANGPSKSVLATAPRRPLPEAVQQRAKSGFSTPVQDWLKSSPDLLAWNRIDALRTDWCPWARRFAYVVADRLGSAA